MRTRLVFALLAQLLLRAGSADAQTVRHDLWAPNGAVYDLLVCGDTLYIAGGFTTVGPVSGGGVPFDVASGGMAASFPRVAGSVYAVASDGVGGWFIGGSFTAVGGLPRLNLAHVLADGTVAPWRADADLRVLSLACDGTTLYAAGWFTTIGGRARNALAGIDCATGALTSWDPRPVAQSLSAVACAAGRLYVSGGFLEIGGQPRERYAAFDLATGELLPWDPGSDWPASCLLVSGDRVYAGGGFQRIGGQARRRIAAVDALTGAALDWDPGADGDILALAMGDDVVYAGGSFDSVAGVPRGRLAAIEVDSGLPTDWNPVVNGTVNAVTAGPAGVYIGGYFTGIRGQWRSYLGLVDPATGDPLAWAPKPNLPQVRALGLDGATLYVGGDFTGFGGVARRSLAALDLKTGQPTSWDAALGGGYGGPLVEDLERYGDVILVAGSIRTVGGVTRAGLAAIDMATGAVTDWNPAPDANCTTILVRGDAVYVCGSFEHIGGQARNYFAAVDARTGRALPWNPNAAANRAYAYDFADGDSVIYVAGAFTEIGGQHREYLAALDPESGLATPWVADVDPVVKRLLTWNSRLYVGGSFSTGAGQPIDCLAALSVVTGEPFPWDPGVAGWVQGRGTEVNAMALTGEAVYFGGAFTEAGGERRDFLAAVHPYTGEVLPWDPGANNAVLAMEAADSMVYVGGMFSIIGGQPNCGLAALSAVPAPPPAPDTTAISEVLMAAAPNPFDVGTRLGFTLPGAEDVVLEVFDTAGRRVATVLDGVRLGAGPHGYEFAPRDLRPGLYLVRLRTPRTDQSKRIVLVR